MKYICAHCGGFSKFPEASEDVMLDSGQVLKCEHCGKETVVDLFTPEYRKNLFRKAGL
jgi:DNA-directed RNA polymerase subunit RPC12/RpoP